MTFKGMDLTPLLLGLISIVGMLLQRAQSKIAESNAQDAAWKRLGIIGLSIAGNLWSSLSAEFQKAIADGKIDTAEREALTALVKQKVEAYTSKAELEKIAVALGLPVPGIIAWIAEYIIDRVTKAHDAAITEVSAKAYPVRVEGSGDVDETQAAHPNAYIG